MGKKSWDQTRASRRAFRQLDGAAKAAQGQSAGCLMAVVMVPFLALRALAMAWGKRESPQGPFKKPREPRPKGAQKGVAKRDNGRRSGFTGARNKKK